MGGLKVKWILSYVQYQVLTTTLTNSFVMFWTAGNAFPYLFYVGPDHFVVRDALPSVF